MTITFRIALGDRSPFPDLRADAYLAHAATAPASTPVREAVSAALASYAAAGSGAILQFVAQRERLREKLARLIGASAPDIALTTGTTRGISDLALCIPWRAGDKIVLFSGEFPANVSPWQRCAEHFGLGIEFVPMANGLEDEGSFLEPLERLLQKGVRLVALSAVQFQTGLGMPLARIAALCERHGAELCVDAIQACGVMPMDVRELKVDYLVCGAHKWMMGLEGSGFVYARPGRARALVPRTAGWLSHEEGATFLFRGPGELRYDRPLKPGIGFFESGSTSTVCFAALEAALDPILALEPAAIFGHVSGYLDRLESGLVSRGLRSLRRPEPERRSAILSIVPPSGLEAGAIVSELGKRGVVASMPDGLVRFAPHFPNPLSEVELVLGALDEVLATLRESHGAT